MKFINETFGNVRGVYVDGESLLVGKDVARALGYKRDTKAVVDHVYEEYRIMVDGKTQSHFGIQLGQRGGWLIKEAGVYQLIFSSQLPNAREFQRWVFEEVLPILRREGEYSMLWNGARDGGKVTRRTLTDTVKAFCEYLQERGELDRPLGTWIVIFTKLVNKKLSIADKRDNLTAKQLFQIDECEYICVKEIESGMAASKGHHDIYKACEDKLTTWRELTA